MVTQTHVLWSELNLGLKLTKPQQQVILSWPIPINDRDEKHKNTQLLQSAYSTILMWDLFFVLTINSSQIDKEKYLFSKI